MPRIEATRSCTQVALLARAVVGAHFLTWASRLVLAAVVVTARLPGTSDRSGPSRKVASAASMTPRMQAVGQSAPAEDLRGWRRGACVRVTSGGPATGVAGGRE